MTIKRTATSIMDSYICHQTAECLYSAVRQSSSQVFFILCHALGTGISYLEAVKLYRNIVPVQNIDNQDDVPVSDGFQLKQCFLRISDALEEYKTQLAKSKGTTDEEFEKNSAFISVSRTESRLARKGDKYYDACRKLCSIARRFGNCATYILRQNFFAHGSLWSRAMLDKYLRDNYSDLYEAMPCSASSQRQSQIVLKNFKSFSKAMKKYRTKKEEFPGRPQLPGYKRKYRTFVVGRNGYSIENGFLSISGAEEFGLPPVPFLCCQNQPFGVKAKDVVCGDFRIVPKGNSFAMEVTYRLFIKRYDVLLNRDNALLVDLGVDNIATCVPTAPGVAPIVFKGGVLKSINWSYNKRMAKLQSSEDKTDENKIKKHNNRKHCKAVAFKRTRRINDLLHKLSHYIIQYCLAYDLGTVIIGKNKNWKQKVNLGKKNNQIFVQLPHDRLIEMIEYKAEAYGINVILADESYTSKASALDFDPVPDYGKENGVKPVFSGKRIKRGLYRTKDGTLINADINGALNIGRKVLGDQWLKTLLANRGQVDRPIVVRNLHASANIKLLLELELRF